LCKVHSLPLLPNGQRSIHWNLIQGRVTLTPENIVWVPRDNLDDYDDPNGILQLGVLGCCFSSLYVDKLSSQSAHDGPLSSPSTNSLTYIAPERVVPSTSHYKKDSRQRCDVWSLGCIFLEAVTWYLLGQKAVKDDFPEARTWLPVERIGVWDVTDDGFFCVEIDEKTDTARAIVNPGVSAWIRRLRIHAACSPYLTDFLSLIEKRMLIVEEGGRERISAKELSDELRRLREKAEVPEYALKTMA
jgi:serine/threonine protein kinase